MKRFIIAILMSVLIPMSIMAQSSMTDDQVMKFIVKEHNAGTPQSQIVTKLMQNGVNIEQIRRVKKKYERAAKDQGLGQVSSTTGSKNDTRLRSNGKKKANGDAKDDEYLDDKKSQYDSQNRLKDGRVKDKRSYVFDDTNDEWNDMRDELDEFVPDTAALLEKLMMEKTKRKVFGRNIFNNKNLSFEPNMNIATPQNYRLGPGDAVFIDIYGASQKTIECTVSPDGFDRRIWTGGSQRTYGESGERQVALHFGIEIQQLAYQAHRR